MSTHSTKPDEAFQQDCVKPEGYRAVELLIEPLAGDIGGFMVRRLLPTRQRRDTASRLRWQGGLQLQVQHPGLMNA
ncbi:hypothetical protein GCM10022265_22770 [Marinobacter xestospongiae]